MLLLSLKSLIGILSKQSFASDSNELNPIESNELNQPPLSLVQPIEEPESNSLEVLIEENDDTALSSFSPEVVEVIEEEEEKIA